MAEGKKKLVSKTEERKRSQISDFDTILRFPQTIFQFFFDLILPKYCFGCGEEGIWLCQNCEQKILPIKAQTCPICNKINPAGRYCRNCHKNTLLSGIIIAAYYEESPLKELIHNFKYNHILELKTILGELLADALKGNKPHLGSDLLISAVPIHYFRRAQRGYNQAEILAEHVANQLKLPKIFKIIKKIRQTPPQVKFSGKKRRENLKNSFKFCGKIDEIKGRTIIIVDDVTTTGTTLNECAKVLRLAGARRIWGLVVARG